jgi:hypothetical protein
VSAVAKDQRWMLQIREHVTSLDLGWAVGVLPNAVPEIIEQYLS